VKEYSRKEKRRKERKRFGEDLFSRMAQGWHGKCWGKQKACQQEKKLFRLTRRAEFAIARIFASR